MAKNKIKYVCTNCGYESVRWIGKCPECDNWNTFTEEIIELSKKNNSATKMNGSTKLFKINEISITEDDRLKTKISELDRVLGGGLIPGSVILLGGDPGIGKSTLAMQALKNLSCPTLYVTGEESYKQIKLRTNRLKINNENIYILAETNLGVMLDAIDKIKPGVVIIDSIQTMYKDTLENSPGSLTQIRECALSIMTKAKEDHCSAIIIGHVTKEGNIAGPKVLEHIVDAVIQFEGETNNSFRILRAQKNRFGSINEIGVFEMFEEGLVEVKNPSELFLSERDKENSGSAVTAAMEGTRPILLEIQALVTPTSFGNPQRVATGFDYKRLSILLAVIEKRSNFKLSMFNVFLNIAGGVRIDEPAADLSVCCSIVSNMIDKVIDNQIVIVGEVGLGGEVRSISHIEKRIQEAEKLGFKEIVIPKNNLKGLKAKFNINIHPVENLNQTLGYLLR